MSIDGDDRVLVAAVGESVLAHGWESDRAISRWTTGGVVRRVALRPGGDRVAVACEDRVEVSDPHIPLRVATLRGHIGWISAIAWSRDGESLATAASDGRVALWEAE